jgi:outer membrane protein OmpA-like peptidoglycan-associated protein
MKILNPGPYRGSIIIDAKAQIIGDINHELNFTGFSAIFLQKYWHIHWNKVREIKFNVNIDYALYGKHVNTPTIAIMQRSDIQKKNPDAYGTGHYKFSTSWLVHYGADGVTFQPQGTIDLGSRGGTSGVAVAIQLAQNQNTHEADAAFVSLLIQMKAGESSDGLSFGLYGVGVSGVGASKSSYSRDLPLKIFLYAVNRPKKEKLATIPEDLLSFSVRFVENERFISDAHLSRLDDWITRMKRDAPGLTGAIKGGKVTILLSGYASTTGSTKVNDRISHDRVTSLEIEIKRKFESQAIRFLRQAKGKREAAQKGAVPAERRVDIKLDRAEAIKAVRDGGL